MGVSNYELIENGVELIQFGTHKLNFYIFFSPKKCEVYV